MNGVATTAPAKPRLGVLEWLRPGEYLRAKRLMDDLKAIDIHYLRTGLSWADWHTPEGKEWFNWLIPTVTREFELLPCFTYTPPSMGVVERTNAPPKNPKSYADFIDVMINEYGEHFEWVELWNEPNNLNDWDWHLDPNWETFANMMHMAANWAHKCGKKTVLAGMCPTDANWLHLMCERGVVEQFDAVGIHGFPGTWEFTGETWQEKVALVRDVLTYHKLSPEIWITEVGYSTWRHDEIVQVKKFVEVLEAPVERIYWYSAIDLHPYENHQDGFHEDERHYHLGLKMADGTPKLIHRIWRESGVPGLRKLVDAVFNSGAGLRREPASLIRDKHITIVPSRSERKPVVITGGSGFVGTNLAEHLLQQGERVLIFDNLSRSRVEENLEWMRREYGSEVQLEIADIRDKHLVRDAVHSADKIFHFAAQVAVVTSITAPQRDFDINMLGTFHILETMRQMKSPPPLLFTSTNKVYGALDNVQFVREGKRYVPTDNRFSNGIDEHQPLNFHSPYGCSKGAAEQYVLDYARTYGLPALVFRMSCIYGPHQFGTEDQGWVAHFLIQALKNKPLTLFGDGHQVRDILFVRDLVSAFTMAMQHVDKLKGRAFNIGGGPANSISLLELIDEIEALTGNPCDYSFEDWRLGDQRYYVSDTRSFEAATGWRPQVNIKNGLAQLHQWLVEDAIERQQRCSATSNSSRVDANSPVNRWRNNASHSKPAKGLIHHVNSINRR